MRSPCKFVFTNVPGAMRTHVQHSSMSGYMRACAWDAIPTLLFGSRLNALGSWWMENEERARRGMSFAACILPLHHPIVQYSYCHVLVTLETYGEICLLLGIPVWASMISACLRLQAQSTGEAGKRDAWARRKWFDTIATPSQGRSFTPTTRSYGYSLVRYRLVSLAAEYLRYSVKQT